MVDDFICRCFVVPAREIGYLRFILEGYEGLAQLRTLEPEQALVEMSYPASQEPLFESLLVALRAETGLKETGFPEDYSQL